MYQIYIQALSLLELSFIIIINLFSIHFFRASLVLTVCVLVSALMHTL